jgi:hypothetical protein
MIRKIYTLLVLTLILGSCKNNNSDSPTCTFPEAPKMEKISISVINSFNNKDYLVPQFYDPADITVVQYCSPSTAIKVNIGSATVKDTIDIPVKAISFDNFTSFSSWDDCQRFEVRFTNKVAVRFDYYVDKERCGNNCCMTYYPHVIVDGATTSPATNITSDDDRLHFLMKVYDPTDTLR